LIAAVPFAILGVRMPRMEEWLATLVAGIVSGVLSGAGAWFAVKMGVKDLEETERRRQRIGV